jgi:cold shock CspA family protein
MRMRIDMFSVHRGYGFCSEPGGTTVFFHAEDFHRIKPGGPPPILGEDVDVEGELQSPVENKGSPRARIVRRTASHNPVVGTVKSFDVKAGWGFVIDPEGKEYFLHRSDMVGSGIPLGGGAVTFYRCSKLNKPRACHVVLHG